jgi:hypothetical protein
MTEQQYIDLGQEVEEYILAWVAGQHPGNGDEPAFVADIINMVLDRQAEPDDGP